MSGRYPPPPEAARLIRKNHAVDIYEALDEAGRPVVVKRLEPDRAASDPVGVRRFRREMRLAEVLGHPSLPILLSRGPDWMAFERLDGSLDEESVAPLYRKPAEARRLLAQLADLLAYVHARGIVHRDVKPAHVMFRGPVPVLIDFGIAELAAGDDLAMTEIAGSPAWMAPELVSGEPARPESDIWSLCALGAWLLSGRRPFRGGADEVMAARRAGAQPDFDLRAMEDDDESGLLAVLREGLAAPESRPSAAGLARLLSLRR